MGIRCLTACVLVFLATILPASALIESSMPLEQSYNLGEAVMANFAASAQSFEGIFRAMLDCGSYTLDYFTTPISFDGSTNIAVPGVTLAKYALGDCKIKAALVGNDNVMKESTETPLFKVVGDFPVKVYANASRIRPNDELKVSLGFGDYMPQKAEITFELAGENWQGSLDRTTIKASASITPGSFPLSVVITDSAGNIAKNATLIEILSVPSSFVVHTDMTTLKPKDIMHFSAEILDQAKNSIGGQVSFAIISGKEKILEKSAATGELLTFMPGPYMKPGEYKLEAKSMHFSDMIFLTVPEWRELDVLFDNRTVNLTNTGNVRYEDAAVINAVKDGAIHSIERKLSLKPGEYNEVDLFNELPGGTYDITISDKEYKAVIIEDERSGFKRVYQGLGSITGAIVGLPGAMSMKMGIAIMAAIAAVAMITFYIKLRKKKERKKII
jgi:hypothetical protein